MFHKMLPPVVVNTEDEEAALGPEWSRRIQAQALPEEQKPAPPPRYEPQEEEGDGEPEEKPQEQPQESTLAPRRPRPPLPLGKRRKT